MEVVSACVRVGTSLLSFVSAGTSTGISGRVVLAPSVRSVDMTVVSVSHFSTSCSFLRISGPEDAVWVGSATPVIAG